MESIVDYLERQAEARPRCTFLSEGPSALSYAGTFRRVKQMAGYLADCGVKKGDRVILLIERKTAHLITYFASISLGAIPVHLHTQRPRKFVEFAVENTQATIVVTQNYAESWEGLSCPVVAFPELSDSDPERWTRDRSELAYMMYTSGTTGVPKAVMTSQANTLFTANTIIDFAQLTQNERELICLPLSFTFGLGHVHAQLILGGQVRLHDSMRDVEAILDLLGGDSITGFLASPGMLKVLAEEYGPAFREAARGLSYIVINCTPMPEALTRRLLGMFPNTRIYMYYGLTEASRSAFNFYNGHPDKIGCTGRATRGVALAIDNPDSISGEGEIIIKGPNVMLGYWGDETRAGIDEGGWFHSGDLGVMDSDGYITVKGRVKEQISVDGMKCQPLEVERVLAAHPEVKDVAVVAIPDDHTYQAVGAAVVTATTGDRAELSVRLKEHCRASLEAFKAPKRIAFVDEIPRTELGKTRRLEVQNAVMKAPEW
jgi:long-chain acyl-CoA synthetase